MGFIILIKPNKKPLSTIANKGFVLNNYIRNQTPNLLESTCMALSSLRSFLALFTL